MAARAPKQLPPIPVLPSLRVARFFSRQLVHGKDQFAGRPFVLDHWELEDAVVPIYDDLVPQGDLLVRRIREALVGVAKKNGKSTLAAGLGAYSLYADGYYRRDGDSWLWVPQYGGEVYNVAGSKPQAKVLFEIGKGFVERSPFLKACSRIYKDAIEVPETDSVWRVLSADAELAHGPNPSVAIIDEIWVHRDAGLYEAFASAGAARAQPLVITITTAGFRQDSVAFALYKRGLKGGDRTFHFRWFQAPDGCRIDDMKALRQANPSPWVTTAYLRKELKRARALGLESQFRRLHGNQWTQSKEEAIPLGLWDSCAGKPRIPGGAEVIVGVDSAPKRDSTGVVVVHRDGKGAHHWRMTKMVADPDTGYLDFAALEDLLREIARTYDVTRILVDPFNMIRSMVLLAEEGLPIEEFPQSDVRMVPASMNLYELLIQGRIRHGGDRELRRQVQAAAKRITERGWRLQKRTSAGVIDGLVAGTIASYVWELAEEEEPSPPEPGIRLLEV